jgi:uncharacterized membrane protein
MASFKFVTLWQFQSPLQPVWDMIYDAEKWPTWWKGVEQVVVVKRGGPDKVGTVSKQVWKSALPYKLRFDIEITKVEPLKRIEVSSDGELKGIGIMTFSTEQDDVIVRFDWMVDTTEWWMNLIAPLARPVFMWNHGVIMDWGAQCLAEKLHVKLVKTEES